MFTAPRRAWAAALAAIVLVPAPCLAAPCPVSTQLHDASPQLAATDAATRLRFLRSSIDAGAKRSRAWSLGWGVSLAALTVGQLALSPALPREDRPDFYVGAIASGVGALTRAVFIPRVIIDRRKLRRSGATGCRALAQAEEVLVRGARWERQGKHIVMHLLSLGFNVGIGLILGLAFKRPVPAHRLAATGAVAGEIMIITQPTPMIRALQRYRSGRLRR